MLPAAIAGANFQIAIIMGSSRRHLADDLTGSADPGGEPLHVRSPEARPSGRERPREEPDLVDHRRDLLGLGDRDRLPGVLALQFDQFVCVGLEQVGDGEQRLLTGARRGIAPSWEGVEAAAYAASTSAAPDSGAVPNTSPVDGSISSVVSPEALEADSPLM